MIRCRISMCRNAPLHPQREHSHQSAESDAPSLAHAAMSVLPHVGQGAFESSTDPSKSTTPNGLPLEKP